MSRSYKHTPYIGDKKTKWAKRQANRKVRHYLNRQMIQDESFAPAAYKKVSESWNICDYYDITTWYEHMRHRAEISEWGIPVSNMIFTPDGEIDWDNEYKLWQKWYVRK